MTDQVNRDVILKREFKERKDKIRDYLASEEYARYFVPQHIHDSVYSYISLGGKSLRPIVLLLSCGAVGGDEKKAMPAAAAIEVFHTWTLVHDDIIDRDEKRRGNPTLHEEFRKRAIRELGYDEDYAKHYGTSIAILAGDIQQGWSVSLLCELYTKQNLNPALVLYLINNLKMKVQCTLVEGETLDIQYSKVPIESLDESAIVDMLWRKTGVLYEFAGRAGAMIGLNSHYPDHKLVETVAAFTSECGTAFQLQDDILGIVGDEELLGKPVGSDVREGKRTTIVYHAFRKANKAQKAKMLDTLGNEHATAEDIDEVIDLLRQLGGIKYTKNLARSYVQRALTYLDDIPQSKHKYLLAMWAEYMIEREF